MRNRGSTFLESKIQKPMISQEFIQRERLMKRISDSQKSLVLLHATIGYGKTVLLTQYAREASGEDCVWYHLSAMDNDCVLFMQYLSAAVKKSISDFDFDVTAYAPFLHEEETKEKMICDFIGCVCLSADTSGRKIVFIFDDFQSIINDDICQIIRLLLVHGAEVLRIIIATKGAVPPFCFRYVLKCTADIMTRQELSFTLDEVQALLSALLVDIDIDLSKEELSNLSRIIWHKTEGWPAGVMFAYIYLKQQRQGFVDAESILSYQKLALDAYFMHELFRNLPYDIQMFLVKTSSLEFLSTELCNAVLHIQNAQSVLDYLEQESLFVNKVGQSDRLFRYHSLFRDFLKAMLNKEAEEEILTKAAEFYLSTTDKSLAVEYALAGRSWDLMQYALESVGEEYLAQGKFKTLERWVSELEKNRISITPNNWYWIERFNYLSDRMSKPMVFQDNVKENVQVCVNTNITEAKVKVDCFGDFRVWLPSATEEAHWRTKKAQELFAYLFHSKGQPVGKDAILLQLWPETDRKSATTLFHTTLYSIRKMLMAHQLEKLIVYDKKKYALKVDLLSSPLEIMDELCRACERMDEEFIYNNRETLSYYQGEYLGGISCVFASASRAYYEQKFIRLSQVAARKSMENNLWGEAVLLLEAAIDADPFEEYSYCLLFQCFQALKEIKQAKRYYAQLKKILYEELDVEPCADVLEAYKLCLARGAATAGGGAVMSAMADEASAGAGRIAI